MDGIDDITQLDNDMQVWEAAFAASMLVLNASLLRELNTLIDRLAFRGRSTTPDELRANLRAVTFFQSDLNATLYRIGFGDALNVLLTHMGQSADRLNSYYGKILSDFDPNQYTDFVSRLTDQTRNILLSTLDASYSKVIGETLSWGVLTKSTAAELRSTLAEKLTDAGLSTRSVTATTSDALYTFSRGYSQAIAEGLNLKHYYYMGTQIATTRSFCAARLGKAFTQQEVESWVDQTWPGKIPGTNAQTIYWYCGGFNCRHRLLPISKTVYRSLNNNN